MSRFFQRIMVSRVIPRISLLFALTGILLMAGCGGGDGLDRREVHGTITVGGEPIEQGNITLFPVDKGPVAAGTITEGEYVIEEENGPIPGEYRVEIIGSKKTGETETIQEPGSEPKTVEKTVSVIPMKYNEQSELTMTVGKDESVVEKNFELDAKK